MAIVSRLDVQLAKRKMKSKQLAERVGLTEQTICRIRTGRLKAIRVDELDAICKELDCGVGDLYEYEPDEG